jgi:hypothetical protein
VHEQTVALTQTDPPGEVTHWTAQMMAKQVGISVSSVQRIWHSHGLQPHRVRQFKLSRDRQFVTKLRDIVGLYVDPPAREHDRWPFRRDPVAHDQTRRLGGPGPAAMLVGVQARTDHAEVRRLLGKGRRDRVPPGSVNMLLAISGDEAHRMKPARQAYMVYRWPLVDLGLSRKDCLAWLARHGYPTPPKSACIGCPFHGRHNDYWRGLRDDRPDEWADAVAADRELRSGAYVTTGLRVTC